MNTFNEYMNEKKLTEGDRSQELAALAVENNKLLYNVALKAKDGADLGKTMKKMEKVFSDKDKINFDKVDWDKILADVKED